jgi:ABC-type sugar transport system ATPase subunit
MKVPPLKSRAQMHQEEGEIAFGKRTILEMRNVSKTYGSTRALHSVSLNIREGEIHSLIGKTEPG